MARGRRIASCLGSAALTAAAATIGWQLLAPPARAGHAKPISFKADLQPILDENCVACHQAGSAEAGLVLEIGKAPATILRVPSRQAKLALIAPGAPDSSYLLRKLEGSHAKAGGSGARMPLGDPLDQRQVLLFRRWIAAGAKNN